MASAFSFTGVAFPDILPSAQMNMPFRAGAILLQNHFIFFGVANADKTRRHPARRHAQRFQYNIVLPVQRDAQGIAQPLVYSGSRIFSTTHHAVDRGLSLLTHSAFSRAHLNRDTIAYGQSVSMVNCRGMA